MPTSENKNILTQTDTGLLAGLLLSGFCALGYEIVWTRLLVLSLGCEYSAVLGVLGGYFLGLSLGAAVFHKLVVRSGNPALYYIVFELIAAGYALLSPLFLTLLSRHLPSLTAGFMTAGSSFTGLTLSMIISGLILLPATMCLGGTLPALVESRKRVFTSTRESGAGMGRLYGANTLGAVIGVLGTVYVLLPRLGVVGSTIVHSLCGLAASGIVFFWQRTKPQGSRPYSNIPEGDAVVSRKAIVWVILAGTGFAGMALEVTGVRILAQVLSNSIYTFANILGVYLIGMSVGAWLYGAVARRRDLDFPLVTSLLLLGLSLSAMVASFPLAQAGVLLVRLAGPAPTFFDSVRAEIVIAVATFLPPTLFMGALFSHLASLFSSQGVGRAVAINNLGGTVAPTVMGLFAIQLWGYTTSFYVVPALYLLLAVVSLWCIPQIQRRLAVALGLVALLGLWAVVPRSLAISGYFPGSRVVKRWEGAMGHVRIYRKTASDRPTQLALHVDGHHRMGGGSGFAEKRWGHVAALLSPRRGNALFLGLGTAASLAPALAYDFSLIEGVELVPEIIEALPYFAPINDRAYDDVRVRIYCSDARRFVASTPKRYRLIVADLYHPDVSGVATLYAREHFARIRDCLADDGVFAQFVPIYQLNERTLRTLLRTFLSEFQTVYCFWGHHALESPAVLLGMKQKPSGMSLSRLDSVITSTPAISRFVTGVDELLSSYVTDARTLREYAGEGGLNSDLNPLIMFEGPYMAYEKRASDPLRGLAVLMERQSHFRKELVGDYSSPSDSTLLISAARMRKALKYFRQGEILSRTGTPRPPQAIDAYLRAYQLHPAFMVNLGMPQLLADSWGTYGDKIFGAMLEITPEAEWLRGEYEQFRALNRQERP